MGYKFDKPTTSKPVFEAKGIEVVRRDGCEAVIKIMKKCLLELFETRNLSNLYVKLSECRYRGGGGGEAPLPLPTHTWT